MEEKHLFMLIEWQNLHLTQLFRWQLELNHSAHKFRLWEKRNKSWNWRISSRCRQPSAQVPATKTKKNIQFHVRLSLAYWQYIRIVKKRNGDERTENNARLKTTDVILVPMERVELVVSRAPPAALHNNHLGLKEPLTGRPQSRNENVFMDWRRL